MRHDVTAQNIPALTMFYAYHINYGLSRFRVKCPYGHTVCTYKSGRFLHLTRNPGF